jgi:RNA polymerase sigma factor FliA
LALDREFTEKFVKENYSVVEAVASTIAANGKLPPGIQYEDLLSWGVEGLIKAQKGFDGDKGAQFKTYANFRIRGEILDNIRKEWSQRSPSVYRSYQAKIKARIAEVVEGTIAAHAEGKEAPKKRVSDLLASSAIVYMLSLDDLGVNSMAERVEDSSENFEELLETSEDVSIVWKEVSELDTDEQQLLRLFYKDEKNQKEISEIMKLSRSKVCRMHATALEKLKRRVMRQYET